MNRVLRVLGGTLKLTLLVVVAAPVLLWALMRPQAAIVLGALGWAVWRLTQEPREQMRAHLEETLPWRRRRKQREERYRREFQAIVEGAWDTPSGSEGRS